MVTNTPSCSPHIDLECRLDDLEVVLASPGLLGLHHGSYGVELDDTVLDQLFQVLVWFHRESEKLS